MAYKILKVIHIDIPFSKAFPLNRPSITTVACILATVFP